MKIYKLYDEELKIDLGALLYFEREHAFAVELSESLDEWTCPLLFSGFIKNGIYTIPRDISGRWVRERILPPDRQNIASILANHKMNQYDEIKLLELSRGKCSQDNIVLTKSNDLPKYLIERDLQNLAECSVCSDLSLICFFKNGETKKASLDQLLGSNDLEKLAGNRALFESCQVAAKGRFVSFDDSIDIPASALHKSGISIPITLDDLKIFIRTKLLDTTQVCNLLACTRQNISYMLKDNLLTPVKENVKGNLYIKGEL